MINDLKKLLEQDGSESADVIKIVIHRDAEDDHVLRSRAMGFKGKLGGLQGVTGFPAWIKQERLLGVIDGSNDSFVVLLRPDVNIDGSSSTFDGDAIRTKWQDRDFVMMNSLDVERWDSIMRRWYIVEAQQKARAEMAKRPIGEASDATDDS